MMFRLFTSLVALSLLASGCCKGNDGATTDPGTTTAEKRFEGTYTSNWGDTTFTEVGSTVTARYPKGSMTCSAAGDVLNCDWVEGAATGKAALTRQANGDITGTWGNGTSSTNGGPWSFTKK